MVYWGLHSAGELNPGLQPAESGTPFAPTPQLLNFSVCRGCERCLVGQVPESGFILEVVVTPRGA